jgi:hypothetical protein
MYAVKNGNKKLTTTGSELHFRMILGLNLGLALSLIFVGLQKGHEPSVRLDGSSCVDQQHC